MHKESMKQTMNEIKSASVRIIGMRGIREDRNQSAAEAESHAARGDGSDTCGRKSWGGVGLQAPGSGPLEGDVHR